MKAKIPSYDDPGLRKISTMSLRKSSIIKTSGVGISFGRWGRIRDKVSEANYAKRLREEGYSDEEIYRKVVSLRMSRVDPLERLKDEISKGHHNKAYDIARHIASKLSWAVYAPIKEEAA